MKYLELEFHLAPYSKDAADLMMALATEAGLESYVDTDGGFNGYVQAALFDPGTLDAAIRDFPMEGVGITYHTREAEDRNWNETWEREGFEPVLVSDKIWVHGPRHTGLPPKEYDIVIDPHQAFGTGTHQTTCLMLERLLGMDLEGEEVLDAGCGTGVLGIFCAMKGARHVTGYDIDGWSVRNTMENMRLNGIRQGMEAVEGDSSILAGKGTFDLVLANINRNILLNDLPAFASAMRGGARLLLSGFYTADCGLLIQKAQSLGLSYTDRTERDGWASLQFIRQDS